MTAQRKAERRVRASAQSPTPLPYEDFLPKPLRGPIRSRLDRLSFIRPYGSLGGHSYWDPPQPSGAMIRTVFNSADFKGFNPRTADEVSTANYAIGCRLGDVCAREYVKYMKRIPYEDFHPSLSDIALDMLGHPSDDKRRGEVIGFFSELEDILHRSLSGPNRRASK